MYVVATTEPPSPSSYSSSLILSLRLSFSLSVSLLFILLIYSLHSYLSAAHLPVRTLLL